MKIEQRNIDKIVPYVRNPRKNDAAVATVASSIKEFGWKQPIVVDAEGVVVCGHTRLLAARQLGMSKVPVRLPIRVRRLEMQLKPLLDDEVTFVDRLVTFRIIMFALYDHDRGVPDYMTEGDI